MAAEEQHFYLPLDYSTSLGGVLISALRRDLLEALSGVDFEESDVCFFYAKGCSF